MFKTAVESMRRKYSRRATGLSRKEYEKQINYGIKSN